MIHRIKVNFTLAFYLFVICLPSSYSQNSICNKQMESINTELDLKMKNRSQLDTSSSLGGESRVYKKIAGVIKMRVGKGVGRHELVYSKYDLIYYKEINSYYKNKRLITLIFNYYYLDSALVKFEDINYERKQSEDSQRITKRNVLYLDNGRILYEDLDKKHPNKTSKHDLQILLENAAFQIDQFRLIRKYEKENNY